MEQNEKGEVFAPFFLLFFKNSKLKKNIFGWTSFYGFWMRLYAENKGNRLVRFLFIVIGCFFMIFDALFYGF